MNTGDPALRQPARNAAMILSLLRAFLPCLRTRSGDRKRSRRVISTQDPQLIVMITASELCREALEGHSPGRIILG